MKMILGKKIQVNIVSGFKVTNSACVGVRSTVVSGG